MRVLDLFSGIGGFSLGLERAGMRTVQFVEIEPFCRAILAKHWPHVPCHDDICTFHAPAGFADVICGGFPCQDISVAGSGEGLAGARSGLWSEYSRLIREVGPAWVIVENVSALLARGLGDILGELSEIGYDAEWHCIPASAVGAPHRRDRIWIVANRNSLGIRGAGPAAASRASSEVCSEVREQRLRTDAQSGGSPLADSGSSRLEGPGDEQGASSDQRARQSLFRRDDLGREWEPEPDVGRVANGIPARAHRLKALGNAVVPKIPELIGRAIMRAANYGDERP